MTNNLSIENNPKLGFYTVGDQIYYSKVQALIAGTNTNQFPEWDFNKNIFDKLDWENEPGANLQELYRMRAQQLREKYDYIRVEASGGGDSSTVIYSFLLNGIHLDEVVFRYPKSGEKDASSNPWSTLCENTLSEYEFAAKPLLNWIATNYPTVKITVHDYVDDMIAEDESWIFNTRHYLYPTQVFKHISLESMDRHENNKNVCVLYGVDKPKVCIKDDKFFLFFTDARIGSVHLVINEYETNECFYWSPDMPELMAKQAHLCKHWFHMPEHYKFRDVVAWPDPLATRHLYELLVKSIIYPDYDQATFQVIKPVKNIHSEMDYWFHNNFKNTKKYNVWEAGINYLCNKLDQRYIKYVHGMPEDIKDFLSPFYYIGECNIPNTGIVHHDNVKALRLDLDQTKYVHVINGKLVIY